MKAVDRILGEAMTPYQRRIYNNPQMAVVWSRRRKCRFPEAEPYIAKDPKSAYEYARDIIRGRWPAGEAAVSKDPRYAYQYAKDIIRGRWPEGEAAIVADTHLSYEYAGHLAYLYAKDVIRGRWPEAEEHLAYASPSEINRYISLFPEAKWEWAANGWIDWTDI